MLNELKRAKCMEQINERVYHSNPNLLSSGRLIKSLKELQRIAKSDEEKLKYEYAINKLLQKHLFYIQEAIINSNGLTKQEKEITVSCGNFLNRVANEDYGVMNEKYTFVDIDYLKKCDILNKSVILKDDLVLPINVKSSDEKYRFKTQIIFTKNNVLTYATSGLEFEQANNLHHRLLHNIGKGIANNELLEKQANIKVAS